MTHTKQSPEFPARFGGQVVTETMQRLQGSNARLGMPESDVREMLTEAGIEPGEWQENTRDELEHTRAIDNARWTEFAEQYARWRGNDPSGRRALGRGAAPIVLVDGRYLITMNTIRRQGGLRAPERLFQTVNAVIRHQLEQRETGEKETTMNHTAATLISAAIALGTCTATTVATAGDFPNWRGKWKKDSGEAEVIDEAHIQMKDSGRKFRIIGLGKLDDPEQVQVAIKGIGKIIDGKSLDCWWLAKPAAEGNPMAAAPDGTPLSTCGVRKVKYTRCKHESCFLPMMAVTNGYGIPEGGAWEQRTRAASKAMAKLTELQAQAKRERMGIWAARD